MAANAPKKYMPKSRVRVWMLLKIHIEKMSLSRLETMLMKTNELE
jgi:hypothetical protein